LDIDLKTSFANNGGTKISLVALNGKDYASVRGDTRSSNPDTILATLEPVHGELMLKSISKATTGKQSASIFERQTHEP
jgi:hypothetical protein